MRNIILCVVFMVAGMSGRAQTSVESELNALFDGAFVTSEPGGSILIKKGDRIVFKKSYGVSDVGTHKRIDENTIFNTGSISKTFVANGILILNERGLLSLDDSVYKYFKDFDNESLAKSVTIRHLLSHTSGLPDLRDVNGNPEFYLAARDIENFEPIKGAKELNFKPGSRFQYSNPAYNGLALIIEQVAGMPWQRFIENEIFKPAGMSNSKITDGPFPDSGVAHAYSFEDDKYVEFDYGEFPTFAAAGNGGIWSSVLDLARYEKAIRTNQFLSEKSITESQSIYRPVNWSDTANPFVGYGWFVEEKDEFRVTRVYHTGSQGGFRAFYISIPEKDILYIALFNRPVIEFAKFMDEGVKIMRNNNWLDDM